MPKRVMGAARELPHGTWQRSRHCADGPAGSTCQPCRSAHTKHKYFIELARQNGEVFWYPASEVRQYITYLVDNLVGVRVIAEKVDTPYRVIKRIYDGETKRVTRDLRERIYRVPVSVRNRLPAEATLVRIHALVAQGWRYTDIMSACTGMRDIHKIKNQVWVSRDTAQKILAMCIDVGDQLGPSVVGRSRALNSGYLPASAFDPEAFYDIEWDGDTEGMRLECPA